MLERKDVTLYFDPDGLAYYICEKCNKRIYPKKADILPAPTKLTMDFFKSLMGKN